MLNFELKFEYYRANKSLNLLSFDGANNLFDGIKYELQLELRKCYRRVYYLINHLDLLYKKISVRFSVTLE